MFKNIIAPMQAWLLSQGRCVGCGTSLKAESTAAKNSTISRVTCKKCGRIFLFDKATRKYQRAPLSEVK